MPPLIAQYNLYTDFLIKTVKFDDQIKCVWHPQPVQKPTNKWCEQNSQNS